MKLGSATAFITLAILVSAQAALAHSGHVHGPGPVHGFSWFDLMLFLLGVMPAPVLLLLWAPRRRRRP